MNPHDVVPGRRGYELLNDPLLDKGIAFTEAERDAFDLRGLLPPYVGTPDEQVARWSEALRACVTPLERYAFMRDLQDVNETVFYRLLTQNLDELLPVVYTPAVGAGCERFSNIYRKPRGLFLSLPNRSRLDSILAHERYDGIKAIVVTDVKFATVGVIYAVLLGSCGRNSATRKAKSLRRQGRLRQSIVYRMESTVRRGPRCVVR